MNAPLDLPALKTRQQMAWASGDYAVIGTTLQIVGESLAEACDLRYDETVLDVAAGNGNATLAAARRGCKVVSTDYVDTLLERGAERARAERFEVTFEVADAEALPYEDASFDAVLSTFGVMFTPDHARAASELARVCRPGGRIGLANWTPEGFIGQVFKTLGRQLPPPAGVQPPSLWGVEVAPAVALRRARRGDQRDAADLQLPLSLGRALHRRVPDLVWAGAQGVRRAAGRQGRRAGARPDRPAEQPEPGRAGFAGGAERVRRGGRHTPLNGRPARAASAPFPTRHRPPRRACGRHDHRRTTATARTALRLGPGREFDYESLWHAQLAPAQSGAARGALRWRRASACSTWPAAPGSSRARRPAVGPEGEVMGVDLSGRMVDAADREARAARVGNTTFARMDAEALALPPATFDVVLCALGLMYMPSPEQALREMRRVLRPGGRMVSAVWGERARCAWSAVFPIVEAEVTSDVCPLFFRLGPPGALARACADAGFGTVEEQRIEVTLDYPSRAGGLRRGLRGRPGGIGVVALRRRVRGPARSALRRGDRRVAARTGIPPAGRVRHRQRNRTSGEALDRRPGDRSASAPCREVFAARCANARSALSCRLFPRRMPSPCPLATACLACHRCRRDGSSPRARAQCRARSRCCSAPHSARRRPRRRTAGRRSGHRRRGAVARARRRRRRALRRHVRRRDPEVERWRRLVDRRGAGNPRPDGQCARARRRGAANGLRRHVQQRRVAQHRRRRDLEARAVRRQGHARPARSGQRARHRSHESPHRVRGDRHRLQRRRLAQRGWRQHLDAEHRRTAEQLSPERAGDRSEGPVHALRGHQQRRRLQEHGRRTHVDHDRRGAAQGDRAVAGGGSRRAGHASMRARWAPACSSRPTAARAGRRPRRDRSRMRACSHWRSIRPIPRSSGPACSNALLRSADGGRTWVDTMPALDYASVRALVLDSARGIVLAGTTRDGVLRSDNGGKTWTGPGTGFFALDVSGIATDPAAPQTAWVATGTGVWRTTDGGATWALKSDGAHQPQHAVHRARRRVAHAVRVHRRRRVPQRGWRREVGAAAGRTRARHAHHRGRAGPGESRHAVRARRALGLSQQRRRRQLEEVRRRTRIERHHQRTLRAGGGAGGAERGVRQRASPLLEEHRRRDGLREERHRLAARARAIGGGRCERRDAVARHRGRGRVAQRRRRRELDGEPRGHGRGERAGVARGSGPARHALRRGVEQGGLSQRRRWSHLEPRGRRTAASRRDHAGARSRRARGACSSARSGGGVWRLETGRR